MAGKTMIGGVAYDVKPGKTLVDGVAYDIKAGKTMIGGVSYDIKLGGLELTLSGAKREGAFGYYVVLNNTTLVDDGIYPLVEGDSLKVTISVTSYGSKKLPNQIYLNETLVASGYGSTNPHYTMTVTGAVSVVFEILKSGFNSCIKATITT